MPAAFGMGRLELGLARLKGGAPHAEAARFLAVGLLNTAFGYLVFALATLAGASALTALLVSTAAGAAFNFQTSRRLVFGRPATGRALWFVALYTALLALDWAALEAAAALGIPRLAAQAALLAPLAVASFTGQRLFVFRRGASAAPGRPDGDAAWADTAEGLASARSRLAPLRTVAAVFALGDVAFLLGFVRPQAAALAVALVALGVWLSVLRPADRSLRASASDRRLWALCAVVALTLCLLGGEGRLFYANTDWQIRDAVLADLSRQPWPVTYRPADGSALVLRAPLGMFLLPALAGRLLGWRAADPALLAQNTLLLAAVLAMLLGEAPRGRRAAALAVILAFSGLDLVGELLIGHFKAPPGWPPIFPHLESWSGGLQYSSLVTDLFWAPNHTLPALAMAGAYLGWRRGRVSLPGFGAVCGLSLLWSPLAVMGAAPFALQAAVVELGRLRAARARRAALPLYAGLALLALGLLPVALFLTTGSGAVEHGVNIGRPAFRWFGVFLVLEVVPLLLLAHRGAGVAWPEARRDLLLCAAVLVLLPFYYVGGSNDLLMRGSIFAITLLAVLAAQGFTAAGRKRPLETGLALAFLAVGAATPVCEVVRALVQPRNAPAATGLLEAWRSPVSRESSNASYVTPAAIYDGNRILRPSRDPAARDGQ